MAVTVTAAGGIHWLNEVEIRAEIHQIAEEVFQRRYVGQMSQT